MTPQEQAARVIGAIQMGDPPERPLSSIMRAVMAESIRAAAAELVLPLMGRPPKDDREDERLRVRDELFAIAAELEAPTNG